MHFCLLAAALMAQTSGPIQLQEGLVIGGVVKGGRLPVPDDSVQAALADGSWTLPAADKQIYGPDGKNHAWAAAKADKDGWIQSDALDGGYFYATYDSPRRQVMLLEAQGDSLVYVNGVARVGDPYETGYVKIPVVLEQGKNEFLFSCGRGRMRAQLEPPPKPVFLDKSDMTLPDVGKADTTYFASLLLVNATEQWIDEPSVLATGQGSSAHYTTVLGRIPPLSVTKVPFYFAVASLKHRAARVGIAGPAVFSKGQASRETLDSVHVDFALKNPLDTQKVTFLSDIDGSVQYFGVVPAQISSPNNALVLSLHGAGVEAIGQAQAYASKTWATIACPTNRRPFGFDWEDWGRLDALEVLKAAGAKYAHDPHRTVLTGHSMGGHGTWHIGTTFPDRFAAIGPSAGWISFASYGGGYTETDPTDVEKVLLRSTNASNTLNQVRNLAPLGVYILHGDKDDNVPVTEARTMRDYLSVFHHAYQLFEQPGAGHWWSDQDEPGASCVDWAPMFDMFATRRIPSMAEVRDVEFHTAAPNVSAKDQWLTIEQQQQAFAPTWAKIHLDPHLRRFRGTTVNAAAITLNVHGALGDYAPVNIELDGSMLKDVTPIDGKVTLVRKYDWTVSKPIPASQKNPNRGSGFKNAMRHQITLVYGTHGTVDENRWMENKARLDSETFWYRGNGSLAILRDTDVTDEIAKTHDLVLYGNRQTNAAWAKLAEGSPVDVSEGKVVVGSKDYTGDNLCCLFCRPSLGANTMVAFVGFSGRKGMAVAERLPYFVSGVAYPDYTVIPSEALSQGPKGVLAAGYFDNDWRLSN